MGEKPFYMIAEDCFERKEFLGIITNSELRFLANIFLEKSGISLPELRNNVEKCLKQFELYLTENNFNQKELIKKYQDLISYTEGVDIFLMTCLLLKKEHSLNRIDYSSAEYQDLLHDYQELFDVSLNQYQRCFSKRAVV